METYITESETFSYITAFRDEDDAHLAQSLIANESMLSADYWLDGDVEILDCFYIFSSDFRVVGMELVVVIGNPRVWLDTRTGYIYVKVNDSRAERSIGEEMRSAINSYYESFTRGITIKPL